MLISFSVTRSSTDDFRLSLTIMVYQHHGYKYAYCVFLPCWEQTMPSGWGFCMHGDDVCNPALCKSRTSGLIYKVIEDTLSVVESGSNIGMGRPEEWEATCSFSLSLSALSLSLSPSSHHVRVHSYCDTHLPTACTDQEGCRHNLTLPHGRQQQLEIPR